MNSKELTAVAARAKAACEALSVMDASAKNAALKAMADAVGASAAGILAANRKDLAAASKRQLPAPMIARLALDPAKLKKISESILNISRLPDPVGRRISETLRPNGLVIRKVGVPIGVILIIYESRPNVTADCMALCLKSGNAVLLKGGSEAAHSNRALFEALSKAAERHKVPHGAFGLVDTSDRSAVRSLLGMTGQIDLVIPRGGEGLIREVARISKIPVIKHYKGICHVYVDRDADLKTAEKIVLNAKVQNPSVCNAMETLLVHGAVAGKFLPRVCRALRDHGVQLRGDARTRELVSGVKPATDRDWATEYLDLILSVRVVKSLDEAMAHIARYGSRHSDAIVTRDAKAAQTFCAHVDSACVFVNASTRLADGGEFGMGAEMGISTDKLHARGPMGLEELTSYKYVVMGNGQIRK